jgi:hypothetical protein
MKTAKKTAKPAKKTAKKATPKSTRRPITVDTKSVIAEVLKVKHDLTVLFGDRPELTPAQRHRLLGSGIRRYGFIDKTFDVSETNMQYAPGTFDRQRMHRLIENIENVRNIRVAVMQVLDACDDHLLQDGDDAFRIALIYYNTVRDLARHGDSGAREVFNILRPFFARSRSTNADLPPTKKQALKDAKAILDGRKDGKILIEGTGRRTSKGERVIVDETGRMREGVKVVAEESE